MERGDVRSALSHRRIIPVWRAIFTFSALTIVVYFLFLQPSTTGPMGSLSGFATVDLLDRLGVRGVPAHCVPAEPAAASEALERAFLEAHPNKSVRPAFDELPRPVCTLGCVGNLTRPGVTRIALLVPSTTFNRTANRFRDLPLFRVFVPSLLKTTAEGPIDYVIYLAYDRGDAFYDNATRLDLLNYLLGRIAAASARTNLFLKTYRVVGVKGAPSWIWNLLLTEAYHDGCEYFYQLNDDIHFLVPEWTARYISELKNDTECPGVGIAGPSDPWNPNTMTQSFLSRRHYEAFHTLYPHSFRNWYSDDWSTHVYDWMNASYWDKEMLIRNTNKGGTRYVAEKEAKAWLDREVNDGRRIVLTWAKDCMPSCYRRWKAVGAAMDIAQQAAEALAREQAAQTQMPRDSGDPAMLASGAGGSLLGVT